MAYSSLLKHRADIYRLQETNIDGMPVSAYTMVHSNVRLFLDLNFIRKGKDPMWTPETGSSEDRSGVAFFKATEDIRPGDRLSIKKRGPKGTFECQGAVDEAYTPGYSHHLEVYVAETPSAFTGGKR